MNDMTPEQVAAIKDRFRQIGWKVSDLGETDFEAVSPDFPVGTHISVTPFYLELGTYITAKKQGFQFGAKGALHSFLNKANLRAKLIKFTCDADSPNKDLENWPILASIKLVTGAIGDTYTTEALRNLLTLWLQDVAEMIADDSQFTLEGMIRK